MTSYELSRIAAQAAVKKKGMNVVIMDLQEISLIADYFVICSGNNINQVQAICEFINEEVKLAGGQPALRIEGLKEGRWILMDFGGVVVHVFQEEERLYYNLERLWGDAKFTYLREQE
ncbi:ribosome silencing factor [Dehalobacterium formicoaceticum]|uniref:Ribosomal silencing factor RsfS n=1 Tax=Dehalobacterium formicoaceticum TaxID=51515 RepID=A0ABT1Y280_9FIRM|nr:ribosome silencing factor [Dehalobacterium formicoaceticum]MCR6544985.1 ribosome silencing factor [Dehalobacterium formicoaceticum]